MDGIGITIIFVLAISFILSFLAVLLILRLSHDNKWFDHINERKIHNENIPRLGGIGFAVAFFLVAVVITIVIYDNESKTHDLFTFLALLLILVFGVFDDFRSLRPRYKLLVQFVAALLVIFPDFTFNRISYMSVGVFPELLSFAITLLWIVGITNAINLIDGIDGLAGGISSIIALSLGVIFFYYSANSLLLYYCVAFFGVVMGFLVFNAPIPKAKIFMGDCGSQFIGFFLAVLPLLERQDVPANLPVPYIAALLLIPIFDTIAAVWRRIRDGKAIASPDMSHVHHKLINMGLSVRGVCAVLCGLQVILGVVVFISIRLEGMSSLYVLGIAYVIVIVFFMIIHYGNRAALKGKAPDNTPPISQ